MNIRELDLGADSAEKDIDQGLKKYFFQSESFKQTFSGKKRILVGNRGVGKSAIFKIIASEESKRGTTVIELTPDEYSYDTLNSLMKKESEGNWGKQSSYSVAWQFLIYNMVFKKLASAAGLHSGAKAKIYNYVRDHLTPDGLNPIGILISYLKRVESVKLMKYEVGIKVQELQKLYELEPIAQLIEPLKQILERHNVCVLIDELDKGWDNSEDAKNFVAGLFQACQRLNQLHEHFKVYVSIRQELFDNIPQIYDDAQKLREEIEVIRWTEEDLLEFIGLRLREAIPNSSGLSHQEKWDLVFTEIFEYRGTKSLNYMIDRTQLRPREFLQFCKICLSKHDASKLLVDYAEATLAEAEYSEQKTKDLASEYRFQYPGLVDVFECFRGMKYTLEKNEVETILLRMIVGEISVGNAKWIHQEEVLGLLRILWQIGFFKVWVIGGLKAGRKSGSSYLGHYELQHINLENALRFQIHNAFRSYLNLKEK